MNTHLIWNSMVIQGCARVIWTWCFGCLALPWEWFPGSDNATGIVSHLPPHDVATHVERDSFCPCKTLWWVNSSSYLDHCGLYRESIHNKQCLVSKICSWKISKLYLTAEELLKLFVRISKCANIDGPGISNLGLRSLSNLPSQPPVFQNSP